MLTYVLSKLSISEFQMIRGEQVGLADMLGDYDIGFYAKEHRDQVEKAQQTEA